MKTYTLKVTEIRVAHADPMCASTMIHTITGVTSHFVGARDNSGYADGCLYVCVGERISNFAKGRWSSAIVYTD